jgi:hypothetical protein
MVSAATWGAKAKLTDTTDETAARLAKKRFIESSETSRSVGAAN